MIGTKDFECRNYNFCLYELGDDSVGHCGLHCSSVGLHAIPGVRYRVTFEVVGVNPEHKPDIESYYSRWANHEAARHARKILRGGKKFSEARTYARKVLKAYNEAHTRYRIAMKLWRAWSRATNGKRKQ